MFVLNSDIEASDSESDNENEVKRDELLEIIENFKKENKVLREKLEKYADNNRKFDNRQFTCMRCKWQPRHNLLKGQQCTCAKNRDKTSDCNAVLL